MCDQQHQQQQRQHHLTVAGSDSAIVRWFCVLRLGSMMALLTAATALRQRRRPVSTSPSSSLINTALLDQSAHHPHRLSSTRLCWSCSPARCSSANQQASRDNKPASLLPRATYRIWNESVPIPLLLNYITYSFNHNRQTAGVHENKTVFTPSNIKVDKHHNTMRDATLKCAQKPT